MDVKSHSAELAVATHCSWLFFVSLFFAPVLAAKELDLSRFERTVVATGLVQPMELDIAPDGRIFLIELAGTIKLIDPQTGQSAEVGKLTVTTEQENGLIGLALDPNYAENHWVYLQYSPPDFSGQRISRFTIVDDRLDMESERCLFSYEEQRRECCHHAGSLEFGPDGNLYIGTGDNTNPFNDSEGYAPIDQRENREPWDAQRSAGNTRSYNGKVLRIRPEADGTYSIPEGNLFPADGSVGHPEIYVMGCRNPWRINVDQRTGFLYWGDVGPDAGQDGPRGPRGYDEINQARQAGNFGWPYFIGDNFAYPIINFETGEIAAPQDPLKPENHSVNNSGSKQLPPAQPAMIYYPGSPTDLFPAVGSGGRTACAGPVYYYDEQLVSENKFPAAYNATLFAFEWSRNAIWAVHMDDDSKLVEIEPFLPQFSFIRPIDLQFDRMGSLYVIEYGETWGVNPDARLIRIDYVRGNRQPVAVARAENAVGREPLAVQLSATESTDKDNDQLTYEWHAVSVTDQQSQRVLLGTTAEVTADFDVPGVYTVELVVSDPAGARSTTTLPVIVGNSRPQVEFLEPQDGDFFNPGEPIRYRMLVRDIEDGTSDFEESEEGEYQFIEGTAPSRLLVEAVPVVSAAEEAAKEVPAGLKLIRQSDCFNCHATNRPLVGPSFVDIANKYRNDPHQMEQSVKRVLQGSTGVWGKVGMLPHAQHSPAEVQQMVEYVYSVTADSANPMVHGFNNELAIPEGITSVRLEASYTDLGREEIPKLTGQATLMLRSRTLQAEHATEYRGTQPLGSSRAEGQKFMGAIEHDGFLRFADIPLQQVKGVALKVASAGAGGSIEIRFGSKDGLLLATVPVEVNGDWEAFYEKQVELADCTDRGDLYFVFKNEQNRGGLMNVDSITLR